MRTTYDLLAPSREYPPTHPRSCRRYSRYAHSILTFFQRHRIAQASHIQRQFAKFFQSDRATRMHLQTLVSYGHLAVRQDHGIGQTNVYSLTQQGLRTIHEQPDHAIDVAHQVRRRRPRGSHFLHELLITEAAVSVTEAVRNRLDLSLPWEERFGLIGTPAFTDLIPDYAFLLKSPQGLLAYFVEVISGEDSPTRIGQKLTQYASWSLNPATQAFLIDLYRRHGAQHPRPQYRLVLIIHDRRSPNDVARIRQVLGQTLTLSFAMRQRIWIASVAELGEARRIDAPVWVRAKDLDAHAQDWEILSPRERRQALHKISRNLPRHRLFP
jgi:Replication-relaxation